MNNRPRKATKVLANIALFEEEFVSSEDNLGIEEDDVAFHQPDDESESSEANILANVSDSDENELTLDQICDMSAGCVESIDETDNDELTSLVAPNGIQWWTLNPVIVGRESRSNVFNGRRGFVPGIRPSNEKEAFLTVFYNLVQIA